MNGFRLQDLSYEGLSRLKMSPKTQQSKGHSDVLTLALSLSLNLNTGSQDLLPLAPKGIPAGRAVPHLGVPKSPKLLFLQ